MSILYISVASEKVNSLFLAVNRAYLVPLVARRTFINMFDAVFSVCFDADFCLCDPNLTRYAIAI